MEARDIHKNFIKNLADSSESFCPMLWNHVVISPNNHKHFCCISNHSDRANMPLKEYWDGEEINVARKQMLNNKKPYQCKVCWMREEAGVTSHRHHNTSMFINDFEKLENGKEHFKVLYENINSTINNEKMKYQPQYYDIKFGNLCNLKCRMCDPHSSSQINKEAKDNTDLYHQELYPHKPQDDSKFLWFKDKDNDFWQEFNDYTDNVYKFKFTGGEPLLINEVIQFLKKLVKENKAKDIMLHLITNATKINEELLVDTLLKFRTLKINVSVDGVYDHYEYIRYPGKWKKLDYNMRLLRKYDVIHNADKKINDHSKVQVSISPVLQMYNLFNMIDIYKYAELIGSVILDTNFVETPANLAPRNLTSEMKSIVIDYYSKHILELKHPEHIEQINRFMTYLSNTGMNNETALKRFATYTKTIDKIRNQSFKKSCPKEYDLLKEYFE